MLQLDRTAEVTATTGLGAYTLGGAVDGYQRFNTATSNTDASVTYGVIDPVSNDWEIGLGLYNAGADTISRTAIYASSNSGSAVNFGAGDKVIYSTLPAQGPLELIARRAADTPLRIYGASGQTAALFQVLGTDPSVANFFNIGADGTIAIGRTVTMDMADSSTGAYIVFYDDTATLGGFMGLEPTDKNLVISKDGGVLLTVKEEDVTLDGLVASPPDTSSIITKARGDSLYVGKTGSQAMAGPLTITGSITLNGGITAANHVTTKTYVDTLIATRLTEAAGDARYIRLNTNVTTTGVLTMPAIVLGTNNATTTDDVKIGGSGVIGAETALYLTVGKGSTGNGVVLLDKNGSNDEGTQNTNVIATFFRSGSEIQSDLLLDDNRLLTLRGSAPEMLFNDNDGASTASTYAGANPDIGGARVFGAWGIVMRPTTGSYRGILIDEGNTSEPVWRVSSTNYAIWNDNNAGARLASIGTGSLGQVIFARNNGADPSKDRGDTIAGSDLVPAQADGAGSGSLSGTWMLLGRTRAGSDETKTSLWRRVA